MCSEFLQEVGDVLLLLVNTSQNQLKSVKRKGDLNYYYGCDELKGCFRFRLYGHLCHMPPNTKENNSVC